MKEVFTKRRTLAGTLCWIAFSAVCLIPSCGGDDVDEAQAECEELLEWGCKYSIKCDSPSNMDKWPECVENTIEYGFCEDFWGLNPEKWPTCKHDLIYGPCFEGGPPSCVGVAFGGP